MLKYVSELGMDGGLTHTHTAYAIVKDESELNTILSDLEKTLHLYQCCPPDEVDEFPKDIIDKSPVLGLPLESSKVVVLQEPIVCYARSYKYEVK